MSFLQSKVSVLNLRYCLNTCINSSTDVGCRCKYTVHTDTAASVTHQEYPLQLVLDVLHPRKGSHSLDHLNENAAHSH